MISSPKTYTIVSVSFLLSLCISSAVASTIKGRILDSKTLEPLTGAIFYDKSNKSIDDEARLDGSFSLKKLNQGKHTYVIQFVGYETQEKEIVLANGY